MISWRQHQTLTIQMLQQKLRLNVFPIVHLPKLLPHFPADRGGTWWVFCCWLSYSCLAVGFLTVLLWPLTLTRRAIQRMADHLFFVPPLNPSDAWKSQFSSHFWSVTFKVNQITFGPTSDAQFERRQIVLIMCWFAALWLALELIKRRQVTLIIELKEDLIDMTPQEEVVRIKAGTYQSLVHNSVNELRIKGDKNSYLTRRQCDILSK